ncbi:MAG: VIT1/CCC1 transporter family protein [Chitinophagaceae bacterium]|nr:VIT1/CCC1 transporter family protein [Chitinophagaceae bacterium]
MNYSKQASVQTEVDAAYLYEQLAMAESENSIAEIYRQLAAIERSHAEGMMDGTLLPSPFWRARLLNKIGKTLGYEYVLDSLMQTEKSLAYRARKQKEQRAIPLSGAENNHVKILQNLIQSQTRIDCEKLTGLEGRRHKSVGGNALRAAVLGANDGLVSNMSLVMGVAGATNGESGVLLAGMAGLLAGALSMALGEWISVKSSQELYERQMALEMEEIKHDPATEAKELQLIYMAKGIPATQAKEMADAILKDPEHAHEVLVKEELGINAEELKGSAWTAAIASFVLFAIGAVIPVIPFMITAGLPAVIWSVSLSAAGLFLIGSAITLFTGRSIWFSGFRQVIFGLAAAAVTFGIGKLIGVNISG